MADPEMDRTAMLSELRALAGRLAMLPKAVAADDPRREDWTEAVYVRGEEPFGRCAFCGVARSPAGCLNLCELAAGHARAFTQGLLDVIGERRGEIHLLEVLGGCTCPAPRLFGYQIERESHDRGCPMISDANQD